MSNTERERQSATRSPRNAGDLDDFVSLESDLATATEKLALAERRLGLQSNRLSELEARSANVYGFVSRYRTVSLRLMTLRASRGSRTDNDRTPVDEASLIAMRSALQEVIACKLADIEPSLASLIIVNGK